MSEPSALKYTVSSSLSAIEEYNKNETLDEIKDAEETVRNQGFFQRLCCLNRIGKKPDFEASAHNAIKILVLGTSNSGKSTIIKQIKECNGLKITKKEREKYKRAVVVNLYDSVVQLVSAMLSLSLDFTFPFNHSNYEAIIQAKRKATNDLSDWNTNRLAYCQIIRQIWTDETCLEMMQTRVSFFIDDSAKYFINNLDRIINADYIPTHEDILRVRQPTTSVAEHCIKIQDVNFLFVDVSGMRNQRKKWIHQFEYVTSLMFVASLSDYDVFLSDEDLLERKNNKINYKKYRVNRLFDSIVLFNQIVNWKIVNYRRNKYSPTENIPGKKMLFHNAGIILFLNKKDLYAKKFPICPLKEYFSDFEGTSGDPLEGAQFIKNKFLLCNKSKHDVYCHFTCAIDDECMRLVIDNVKETIFSLMIKFIV